MSGIASLEHILKLLDDDSEVVRSAVQEKLASMRKLSSLVHQMDNFDPDGPLWNAMMRPANEAGAWEDERAITEADRRMPIYRIIDSLSGGLKGDERMTPLGISLNREARLAVMLNAGNEQNLQRLLADGWTMEHIQALAQMMSPAELDFVNRMWRYLDSFWPEVSAIEKRTKGVAPEKVDPVPFTVTASDGSQVVMDGGYYPLAYDAHLSPDAEKQEASAEAKDAARGAALQSMTRHGHTQHRMERLDRKVKLDLSPFVKHVREDVHDLA